MSKMSTKPSGGSGAMFWRAGSGGTGSSKFALINVMSKISENLSLFRSAGHPFAPQWASGFVPAEFSTVELNPSQSGSLAGTGQGGRFWSGFGQFGQLSEALA